MTPSVQRSRTTRSVLAAAFAAALAVASLSACDTGLHNNVGNQSSGGAGQTGQNTGGKLAVP